MLVSFHLTVLKLLLSKIDLAKSMIHLTDFMSGSSQLMVSKEKRMTSSYYQQLDPMGGAMLGFLLTTNEQMLL